MNRASLDCTHRPPCPGCPRLGEDGIAPSAAAALAELATRTGLSPPEVLSGNPTGFRVRARLAIRGRAASPKIGIFEEGSHRIVDVPRCLVHHPRVNEVAAELRRAIVETRTPPYSDAAHRGLLRYVQIVVERRTLRAQVVLVTNDDSADSCAPLASALEQRLGPRLHSLFWNGNPVRTNAILGPHFQKLSGDDAVIETIGGARVFYPPGAFGQNNLDVADRIVDAVHGFVPDGASVVELYAGAGAIGLGLANRVRSLVLNEVSEASLAGLSLGVEELGEHRRASIRIVPGLAASAVGELAGADVAIVDPPRKGLDHEVLTALRSAPPRRTIYVACGLASFLADAAVLLENPAVSLTALSAFDAFPHTEHVETLGVFDRRD